MQCEIRIQGHLDRRWDASFVGLILTNEPGGTTAIRGPVADQAALHGLLQQLRDLGLPLVSVSRLADPTETTTTTPKEPT